VVGLQGAHYLEEMGSARLLVCILRNVLVRDVISGLRVLYFAWLWNGKNGRSEATVGRIGVFCARGHDTSDIPVKLESVESECCLCDGIRSR
jgi:hypothetical protein